MFDSYSNKYVYFFLNEFLNLKIAYINNSYNIKNIPSFLLLINIFNDSNDY